MAETEALARLADTVVTLAERWMVTSCDRMDKLAGEAKAICLKRLCDEEFPRVAIRCVRSSMWRRLFHG